MFLLHAPIGGLAEAWRALEKKVSGFLLWRNILALALLPLKIQRNKHCNKFGGTLSNSSSSSFGIIGCVAMARWNHANQTTATPVFSVERMAMPVFNGRCPWSRE